MPREWQRDPTAKAQAVSRLILSHFLVVAVVDTESQKRRNR
jgi:hypothetical protein